jgi:SAM-dependent methyltransferase
MVSTVGRRAVDDARRAFMSQSLGWDEVFDPHKSGWDSIVSFLGVAQALAAQAKIVVDVGCGRGAPAEGGGDAVFHDLRGPGRHVIGIDLDPVGAENPIIDEFRLIEPDGRWPVDDASVDLAISDFVLEHVDDPAAFVAELARTLRPGGVFVARTISRYSPLSFAARRVPNDQHSRWISTLQPKRQEKDVFPTRYLMNSERALHALLDADFEWTVQHRVGHEQYFLRWPRLARTIMAVEPRLPKAMQMTLVVFARRK